MKKNIILIQSLIVLIFCLLRSSSFAVRWDENFGVCVQKAPLHQTETPTSKVSGYCAKNETITLLKVSKKLYNLDGEAQTEEGSDKRYFNYFLVKTQSGKTGWVSKVSILYNFYAKIFNSIHFNIEEMDLNGDGIKDRIWLAEGKGSEHGGSHAAYFVTVCAIIKGKAYYLPEGQRQLFLSHIAGDEWPKSFKVVKQNGKEYLEVIKEENVEGGGPPLVRLLIGFKNNQLQIISRKSIKN